VKRWYLILLAAYGVLISQAIRDTRKLWRRERMRRAVMGK